MKRNEWVKSTRSGNNGQCVEAMDTGPTVLLRDTKDNGNGPVLKFDATEWSSFVTAVKASEFDISE